MDKERTWLLLARKFSAEATPDELKELEDLFESDPDLRYAYSLIGGLQETGAKEDAEVMQKALEKIDRSLQEDTSATKKRKVLFFRRRRIWLVAASAALMVAAAGGYYAYHHNNMTGGRATAFVKSAPRVYVAAQASSIVLQDGTKVWLNSGSKLRCSNKFNRQKREVMLTGEAFFEVAHDASRPFIVHAGNLMDVKVLGTSFNVKAYPGDPFVEASLISGKIAVDINSKTEQQVILKPHEKLTVYARDTLNALNRMAGGKSVPAALHYRVAPIRLNPIDNAVSELSWMKDKLAFNDITFQELAYDLERIYHVKIRFGNESLRQYHLTGVFRNEDLNEVLHALQVTTPFQYTISRNVVRIYQ